MSLRPGESEMPDPDAKPERAGGRLVIGVVAGLALLVGGGYAAAYFAAGDRVPRGTAIESVEVGGQTPAEAVRTLREGLAVRQERAIPVSVGNQSATIDPAAAGLSVDHEGSVAQAGGGRSWDPGRLWDYYTGGDDLEAIVEVDRRLLDAALTAAGEPVTRAPREGAVQMSTGRVKVTRPRPGRELDLDASAEAVEAAFPAPEGDPAPPVELSLVEVPPEIGEDAVREAVDGFANVALSGPVTLVFGKSPVKLRPVDYAPALSLEPVQGRLEPRVDEGTLNDLVGDATSEAGAPVDATVRLVEGKPKVVPAKPGVTFEPSAVSKTFLDLVTRPEGERTLKVESKVQPADFTTKDAKALKIREQVSSFSTYYPYAEYRNVNIGRAAELVDGTVLKPGDVFSMNDIVGERTRKNGFTEGFIISNGILKEDLGGGVSQLATTLFNGMFFAGLEDVEHKPHSFYIDRYPVGREATVAFGAIDLRFRNDTEYGVLVDAKVLPASPGGQGEVRVRMFSTKVWDITTDASDRYAFTSPDTRTLSTPGCTPNSGYGGFQIDVFRYFRKAGESKLARKEKFHTVYTPSDTVICK